MIEYINDIDLINCFLKKFDQKITSSKDPFKKYLVYKTAGEVISFTSFSIIYDRIELDYIYTVEKYRNKNYASQLLNYVINLGYSNKCINITLEVRKSNIDAIAFYKKHYFKEVSYRKNYYQGEDGILMIRELV